jgi:hypothetical protein
MSKNANVDCWVFATIYFFIDADKTYLEIHFEHNEKPEFFLLLNKNLNDVAKL